MKATLFGSDAQQEILTRIYREGQLYKPSGQHVPEALLKSGLIEFAKRGRSTFLVLAPAHPAYYTLVTVLTEISGAAGKNPTLTPPAGREYAIDPERPLGHQSICLFRILLHVARSRLIQPSTLRRMMPDIHPRRLQNAIAQAKSAGLLSAHEEGIQLTSLVPDSYKTLILEIGQSLAVRDPLVAISKPIVPARPSAFRRAADGAPRLFGSDIRLRNLMALAKHGPIYADELRQLTGVYSVVTDSESDAPFGRGNVVDAWEDAHGTAYQLHPKFPLRLPLRRLLLKLEEAYPLPPFREAAPFCWTSDQQT